MMNIIWPLLRRPRGKPRFAEPGGTANRVSSIQDMRGGQLLILCAFID